MCIRDSYTSLHSSRSITLEKLEAVTRHVATLIDGDLHKKISDAHKDKDAISSTQQSADYAQLHTLLRDAYESHGLKSPIYTFVKSRNKKGALEFICTSSENPYFRHLYSTFPEKEFEKLDEGGTINVYEDEFGRWLSAFYPIKNKSGAVIAYVQADEKYEMLKADVTGYIVQVVVFNHLALAIIILLLFPLIKKIALQEEEHKKSLQQSLLEKTEMSKKLEVNEIKLKEYARKLENSNKDLNDFAHIASHDLKAPLKNIESFSSLLSTTETQLGEDSMFLLNAIVDNTSRAQNLIHGLLNYSTIGTSETPKEIFSLQAAVDEAVLSLKSNIDDENALITVYDLPEINGDKVLITQVIQNLINNGIKYNNSKEPLIEIGSGTDKEKGDFVYIKDNGIGIEEKHQHEVFKMFKRLHNQSKYEGSGIGLAFCARVIAKFGGAIWLDSTPGEGTTIFFTLEGMKLPSRQNPIGTSRSQASKFPLGRRSK